MTSDTRAGQFATTNLPAFGCGKTWNIVYNATSVVLQVVAQPGTANLAVTNTDAPDPIAVGDPLTYTVTVSNAGPDSATNTTLIDTLPAGTTFVSATPSQGTCSHSSGTVTCNLGTIGNGANAVTTIVVTPTAPGTITNNASAASAECDPSPGNETDIQTSTEVKPACPDTDNDGFAVCDASCLPSGGDQCGDCKDEQNNFARVRHGEQDIEIHRPLPPMAKVKSSVRVAGIYDKGKAALVVLEVATKEEGGAPLFTNRFSLFLRGEGGFGGDAGPKAGNEAPSGAPDLVVESKTLPQQALLYPLSGDKNPLHADPAFAKMGGFETPILHGLCSFGIVCKAAVDKALAGDVTKVARYQARFAGVVFPGETIVTSIWKVGSTILVDAITATLADHWSISRVKSLASTP